MEGARWEATCPRPDGRNNENDNRSGNLFPRLALEDLFRMMATVFPAFFLLFMLIDRNRPRRLESNNNHPASLISIAILLALRITRPPIIQLWNATPDANGNTLHNRGSLPAVTTPVPTRMERHLLTDRRLDSSSRGHGHYSQSCNHGNGPVILDI